MTGACTGIPHTSCPGPDGIRIFYKTKTGLYLSYGLPNKVFARPIGKLRRNLAQRSGAEDPHELGIHRPGGRE